MATITPEIQHQIDLLKKWIDSTLALHNAYNPGFELTFDDVINHLQRTNKKL